MQAQFRKEDMEIAERVEDLANSLTALCHDYKVPTISPPLVHARRRQAHKPRSTTTGTTADSEEEEEDEEEFKKYCQNHTNLMRSSLPVILVDHGTTDKQNMLPGLPETHMKDCRSKHNEKDGLKWMSNSLYHLPRKSYPQDKESRSFKTYQDRVYSSRTHQNRVYPSRTHQDRAYSSRTHQDRAYSSRTHQDRAYSSRTHQYCSRPFSYQEISYEENDFDDISSGKLERTKLSLIM